MVMNGKGQGGSSEHHLVVTAIALVAALGAMAALHTSVAAQTPPPTATPSNATPTAGPEPDPHQGWVGSTLVHLPIFDVQDPNRPCDTRVRVVNAGAEPSVAVMMTWGAPEPRRDGEAGDCTEDCAPAKAECSGLIQPGGAWTFAEAQIPAGTKSAAVYSFNNKPLEEIIGGTIGVQDTVGNYMCETLFFGVVGDCADYRRFRQAYYDGAMFAGLPLDQARGAPLAVEVERGCPDAVTDGATSHASYNGVPGTALGGYDPVFGGFGYTVPVAHGDPAGLRSTVHMQNAGSECAAVEVWFTARDACQEALECGAVEIPPGVSETIDLAACAGETGTGSAWVRSSQALAVTVDTEGRDAFTAYNALPSGFEADPSDGTMYPPGDTVVYGPLVYADFQHWASVLHIQNTSAVSQARVKAYFIDRSGDVVTTVTEWVCPRGGLTLDLAELHDVPGNWIGSVRVESEAWASPQAPLVAPPPIAGVVEHFRRLDGDAVTEAIAASLIPEARAFDWQDGAGDGGLESGVGMIAVPWVIKDVGERLMSTDLAITNLVPKPGFTDFAIFIYDQNGLLDYVCEKLNEKQTEYVSIATWGYANPGFRGSAMISALFWEHEVIDENQRPMRNLLGLGAAVVQHPRFSTGGPFEPDPPGVEDAPGDASFGGGGIPLRAADGHAFVPPLSPECPGLPRRPTPTGSATPADTPTPTAPRTATPAALPFSAALPLAIRGVWDRSAAPPAPSPVAETAGIVSPVHVPAVNFQGAVDQCTSSIAVQNVGDEPSKAALIAWGEAGLCPPQCAGPLKVECTGLIKPGGTFHLTGAQVTTGANSAVLYSFTARTLYELGITDLGFDDVMADLMCETLFFGVVGDCDDYRRFKVAYEDDGSFAGLPMEKARGAPIVAEVHRGCPGDVDPDAQTHASYAAVTADELGVLDTIVTGDYGYFAPLVYADLGGLTTYLYMQNAGVECASVELWLKQQDDCFNARICEVTTLASGEAFSFDVSGCVGPGWRGSAWIRASQPLAIAVDAVGRDTLTTYTATPREVAPGTDGGAPRSAGSATVFGPLVYSEYQGWSADIQVFNLDRQNAAKAKVYFLDRSGDIITTLVDWVCPQGSQTFSLPVVEVLPGNWVGSVRVESTEAFEDAIPPITGVVALRKHTDRSRTATTEAVTYRLLSETDAFDWKVGHGTGGLESGVGLVAVPSVAKDRDGSGIVSELAITNLVPVPGYTDYVLALVDQNGPLDTVCQRLYEKQVRYVEMDRWGHIAAGFRGGALISAATWHHPVTDTDGRFVRNVVGLGAVAVQRSGTRLGTDAPGDESAGTLGVPIRGRAQERLAAALGPLDCPEPEPPPPVAAPRHAALASVSLPVLDDQNTPDGDTCEAWLAVQSLGDEPAKVALVYWGAPSDCDDGCAGPLAVECTGLIRPGTTWHVQADTVPDGARSAAAFSLTARTLFEIGVTDLGFDDVVADILCETLSFGVKGDCDDFAQFRQAFDEGGDLAQIPLDRAYGAPIAVHVHRRCDADGTDDAVTASYPGLSGVDAGPTDQVNVYGLPGLFAGPGDATRTVYVQNAGPECAEAELAYTVATDFCADQQVIVRCGPVSIAPGESVALDPQACADRHPDSPPDGAGVVTGAGPLAVVVDTTIAGAAGAALTSHAAPSSMLPNPLSGSQTRASEVAFGPLVYSEYQGWDTTIHVRNHSPVRTKVKTVFMDRSGDIITSLVEWLCPGGGASFHLPTVHDLPGNWVGSVRVEAEAQVGADGHVVPPGVQAVAESVKWLDGPARTTLGEAYSYRLLAERDALDWPNGHGRGGPESGAAVLALTALSRASAEDDAAPDVDITTELAIANLVPQNGFTDFVVFLYDQNGLVDYVCQKLNERQVEYMDLTTWGFIQPEFVGGAIVSAVYWEHPYHDGDGVQRRNLVGLGAVVVQRASSRLGEDIPGDEVAASPAQPMSPEAAALGLPIAQCPPPRGSSTPAPTVTPEP